MTYADDYSLRATNISGNLIASAIDGLLTRHWGGTTTGTSTAFACSTSPTFNAAALVAGTIVAIYPHAANTGSSTLNANSTGNKNIVFMGQSLVGGEIQQNCIAFLMYDGANWILLNHSGGWASWSPTLTASHGTWTGSSTVAKYRRFGTRVDFVLLASGTTNNASVNELRFTLPVTASSTNNARGGGSIFDGAATYAAYWGLNTTGIGFVSNYNSSTLGSGASRQVNVSGFYETA